MVLAFVNPNIQPAAEYDKRFETFKAYCTQAGFEYREFFRDELSWEHKVAPCGMRHEQRCRACYRLRFEAVAKYADEQGFEAISTTLSVSPYQSFEDIKETLERCAEKYNIGAIARDFTEYYQEATQISRDLEMYRQDYCGCRFSAGEAARDRAMRKQARQSSQRIKRGLRRLLSKQEVEERL